MASAYGYRYGYEKGRGRGLAEALALLALAILVGAALPGAVRTLPAPLVTALPLALPVLAAAIVLAVARPALLLVTAFALLSVVRSDPAPSDVLFVLLIGASAVTPTRIQARVPPGIAVALAGFAVLSVLSAINARDFGRAIFYEAITLYLVVLAVWLTRVFQDGDLTRRAVRAYVLTAIASAAVGVAAVKLPFPGADLFRYDALRAQALFKDPNVFGPFLVPPAAIVLEELGRPRLLGWSTRRLVVALLVLVSGVVFAFSRAGWLNLAVAFLTILLVYAARRRGLRVLFRSAGAIVLCGVAGLGFLTATGSLSFLEERSQTKSYDRQRFENQGAGLARATDHVFGAGPGQSEVQLDLSTHSLYVRVAYEQGLIGVALLTFLLAGTVAAALGLVVRDGSLAGIGGAALLGSWLGLVANSFFVDTLHWRHLWIVAGLIWAAAAAPHLRQLAAGSARPEAAPSRVPVPAFAHARNGGPPGHRDA